MPAGVGHAPDGLGRRSRRCGSFFDALHEAFAAYREYERLRTRGIPHDAAIRESLGAGLKPSPVGPDAVRALSFAGRA